MIADREIWACANHVIGRYGEQAWFHAAQRADALSEQGDMAGSRTWVRILDRIATLQALESAGQVH